MTVTLDYADKIAIVHLGEDENRFSPTFLDDIDDALDQAVSAGAQGLITTAAGKFYSNGLDLDWLSANTDRAQWYIGRVHRLLARMLTLPCPPRPQWWVTRSGPERCWPSRMTFA